MKSYENFYHLVLYFSYVLYFITLIGISYINPKYLSLLQNILKYFVILFLLFKFHPFQKNVNFTNFDREIVFSSALFLLATSSLTEIVKKYFYSIKSLIQNSFQKYL